MQIAAGVTTIARREGISYLESTLASLKRAGFEDPVLFDDIGGELGPYRNFKRALAELAAQFPQAEALAVFQDDIEVAAGLCEWLAADLWPDRPETIGVCSLYCASTRTPPVSRWSKLPLKPDDGEGGREDLCDAILKELHERGASVPRCHEQFIDEVRFIRSYPDLDLFAAHVAPQPGIMERWRWYRRLEWQEAGQMANSLSETDPWNYAYGACAYVIPRTSVEYLVHRCRHPESKNKTDLNVAESCWREGLSLWVHYPGFVQHIGQVSSLHSHGITEHRQAGKVFSDVRTFRHGKVHA